MASATSGSGVEPCVKPGNGGPPQTPVLTVGCRMLRSPSHESVTTDLSLFSVSSLASEAQGTGARMRLVTFKSYSEAQLSARVPSPNPPNKASSKRTYSSANGGQNEGWIPYECCCWIGCNCRQRFFFVLNLGLNIFNGIRRFNNVIVLAAYLRRRTRRRPPDIPEILWFEEENDLIKSCAALSSALGFQKSFSTSDISTLPSPEETLLHPSRCAVSDLALSALQRTGYLLDHARLDHASRSCSTWVAVGDVASTSQLPSPHGGHSIPPAPTAAPPPVFTAADLIRSVNKKVRQNYIRRRLLTTYKALERLSQSEFNLDRLELQAVTEAERQSSAAKTTTTHLTVPGTRPPAKPVLSPGSVIRAVKPDNLTNKNFPLTLRDVERDRGKPLSKYERNMMIFNWLHTLDDTAFEGIQ